MLHNKNSINCVITTSIIFQTNKFIIFSNKISLKNELCVWTNTKNNFLFFNSMGNSFNTLIDIIAYDSSLLYWKFYLNKYILTYKIYNMYTDSYTNFFFTKSNSLSGVLKPSLWLEREVRESFHYVFLNLLDTRNLLLDYNLTSPVLLKTVPLEFFKEIKTHNKSTSNYYSQTVEL